MRQVTGMLTPKGLKIRLDGDFCNQLPLKENITIDKVLAETENFVVTPRWLLFIVGLVVFFTKVSHNTLFIAAFITICITSLASWIYPLYTLTRSLITSTQPRIFITISGWFLDKIVLIAIGYFMVGLKGVLYFFTGFIIATIISFAINIFLAKSNYNQFGVPLQSDEKAFIYTSLRYMDKGISYFDWIKGYHQYLNS
ncbi:MAG: hypothetical protein K0S61_3604 [Anaerocolumna sp.]|jgi:hypothetical protein|nr:hypothetical protein [Anaerocolumna sp.]